MSNKLNISDLPVESFKILGINAEEKVWKISFTINDCLDLNLQRVESTMIKKKKEESTQDQTLFPASEEDFQSGEADFFYLDEGTLAKYSVILCAGAGMKLPKAAKSFRYFLFLRYTATNFDEERWRSWSEKLKTSPFITTLKDLSHLQELKYMLS